MTENEKEIRILRHMKNLITVRTFEEEALKTAIQALEEIQRYKQGNLCLVPTESYKKQCEELDSYKELGTAEDFKAFKTEVSKNHCSEHNKEVRAKTIDDFIERMKGKAEEMLKNPDIVAECKKCTIWKVRDIEEIAEQLKGEI